MMWEATLYVRNPRLPELLDWVEGTMQVMVTIPDEGDEHPRLRAIKAAEEKFRELGLGTLMDLPDARVSVNVSLY